MARHHNVTIREGTSEKNWYVIAGYVASAILVYLYIGWMFLQSSGSSYFHMFSGIFVTGLAVGGFAVYPALFKDASYIRGTGYRWQPKWWYYIGFGLAPPLGAFFFMIEMNIPRVQMLMGFLLHAVTAPIIAAVYLYYRHENVGVP